MKANFALSLSFDGITLLERVDGGWCERGSVSLDTDQLEQDMAKLWEKSERDIDDVSNVKIVLPNEQIKYLVLPGVTDQSDDAIEAFIRQELEGTTPYPVADLRFDWCVKDSKVYVAAVALETLEEAESFAIAHRFTPLGHVAIAPDGAFDGEVHFGSFRGLSPLDRDDEQIIIVPAPPEPVAEPTAEDLPILSFTRAQNSDAPPPDVAPVQDTPVVSQEPDIAETTEPPEETSLSGIGAFFVSKRPKAEPPKPEPIAAPQPLAPSNDLKDEKAKLTVFGAREMGRSLFVRRRKLPLIWIAALLFMVTLAGAYQLIRPSAVVQTDVALLSEQDITPDVTALPDPSLDVDIVEEAPTPPILDEASDAPEIDMASIEPTSPESDEIELSIAEIEASTETEENSVPLDELRRRYAVTGIWPVSPDIPNDVAPIDLGDLYIASIDPSVLQQDAIALPSARSFSTETLLNRQGLPAPSGSVFEFNNDGVVTPTKEGTLSPDGHMVYLGRPDIVPPLAPRSDQAPEAQDQIALGATGVPLQELRPRARPDISAEIQQLQEQRNSLALLRPQVRPKQLVPPAPVIEEDAEDAAPIGIAREMAQTRIPKARPKNLNTKVKITSRQVTATPTKPSSPTKRTVAARATDENSINLRKVNLIGVFGKGNKRRALVRLSSGRRQMVEVGDRIDGGKVAAISADAIRYTRFGKDIVLRMPKG